MNIKIEIPLDEGCPNWLSHFQIERESNNIGQFATMTFVRKSGGDDIKCTLLINDFLTAIKILGIVK